MNLLIKAVIAAMLLLLSGCYVRPAGFHRGDYENAPRVYKYNRYYNDDYYNNGYRNGYPNRKQDWERRGDYHDHDRHDRDHHRDYHDNRRGGHWQNQRGDNQPRNWPEDYRAGGYRR